MRETMLILHFIGLAMGLGTAFAHAFMGFYPTKAATAANETATSQGKALSLMGNVGLVLLVISGIYLIIPYWIALTSMPLLMVKLALVLILIVLIAMIGYHGRKAASTNPGNHAQKAALLVKISLIITLATLIIAVIIFYLADCRLMNIKPLSF